MLSLKAEPYSDSFTFVDCSKVNSGRIVKELQVQIGNALIFLDFHALDVKVKQNFSLLFGRALMAILGAVCDIETKRLYLSLIDQNNYYEPVKTRTKTAFIVLFHGPRLVAMYFCDFEQENNPGDGATVDTQSNTSINENNNQFISTHP